jgi:pimeloyl-ACP methyl ester carboxylesterase
MIPIIFSVINEPSRKLVRKRFVRSIPVKGGVVDSLTFGKGPTLLIILGLGDGIRTVKDISLILMFVFLLFAKRHQVVIMSRRRVLRENMTTQQVAEDYLVALEELSAKDLFVWGNSAGGPIAQAITVLQPEKVKGLILSKTFCRPNAAFIKKIQVYLEEFKNKKLTRFIEDCVPFKLKQRTLERVNKISFFLATQLLKRHGEERVFHILSSLCTFDQYEVNQTLYCPVLILNEKNDSIIPYEMQEELASSFSDPKVVTTKEIGEGHRFTLKSFFLYKREIMRFINSLTTDTSRMTSTTEINNM